MKLQQAAHSSGLAWIVDHTVGRQPEFAQPHIKKKNGKKSGEVENVLLHWNSTAERGSEHAESCSGVGIVKKPLRENEIEREAQRNQDCKGSVESALGDVQSLVWQQPSCDHY